LGIVYPVIVNGTDDAGVASESVHLLHRQLDVTAPLEDIVFARAATGFPAVAVQTAAPRSLIVGYSSYGDAGVGYAALARYVCAEDGD
jgi:hypothetical protein